MCPIQITSRKSKLKEGLFLILGNDITIISSSSVSVFSIKVIWKKKNEGTLLTVLYTFEIVEAWWP